MNRDQIRQLLTRPTESLNIEVKTWIDPRTPEGIAKVVKGVFALRNRDGGVFVIGFDDEKLTPDPFLFDTQVRDLFHIDVVQGVLSKYANQAFEVEMAFDDLDGVTYPAIVVPEGVRVPVVVKSDLPNPPGKHLLSEGDLYFRTLNANGTPSSAKIRPNDYERLLDICFENREADIGRFLRRHLGQTEREAVLDALFPPGQDMVGLLRARTESLIERGDLAFFAASAGRVITQSALWMPPKPLTMAVALCLHPPADGAHPTQDFLRMFFGGNPNYTGWPIWLDSRHARDGQSRPFTKEGAWQSLVLDLETERPHSDFMLLDPRGDFYLRRLMQDDVTRTRVEPGKMLDVVLMLYRVAEVFAVGLAVSKSSGWERDGTAGFRFRWSGLRNRSLGAWANTSLWDLSGSGMSRDEEAGAFVDVPLDTPPTALAPYVSRAVGPLFSSFEGYVVEEATVESCVRKLIERRMDS